MVEMGREPAFLLHGAIERLGEIRACRLDRRFFATPRFQRRQRIGVFLRDLAETLPRRGEFRQGGFVALLEVGQGRSLLRGDRRALLAQRVAFCEGGGEPLRQRFLVAHGRLQRPFGLAERYFGQLVARREFGQGRRLFLQLLGELSRGDSTFGQYLALTNAQEIAV